MQQIIVKRPANVSSQEALSHLVSEYADAEVLSFRRVKSAGLDGDFFVATLRLASPEEFIEEESVNEEKSEDDKLDEIISLVKDLIKKDEEVHNAVGGQEAPKPPKAPKPSLIQERPPVKNPAAMMQPMGAKEEKKNSSGCDCWDGYRRVPGTKACEEGSCKKCDAGHKNAMIVIERNANVSKSRAKLELLKEFGKKYKIARLAKVGNMYSATLLKRSDCDCRVDGCDNDCECSSCHKKED